MDGDSPAPADADEPTGSVPSGEVPAGTAAAEATAVPRSVESALQSVLAGFDADEETARRAGHAACLLVAARPALARSVTRGLLAKLAGNDRPRPLLRTLSSLEDAAPAAVQRTLADVVADAARARVYGAIHRADPWRHSGRLRADGGQAVADDDAVLRQVARLVGEGRVAEATDAADVASDRTQDDRRNRERPRARERSGDRTGRSEPSAAPEPDCRAAVERLSRSQLVTAIRLQAGFDELRIMEPPSPWRYGRLLRARAVVDGDPRGVAIRLPHRPQDVPGFEASLGDALAAWQELAPLDGTVSVLGWGERPRPWFATTSVEESLADREPPDADGALAQASRLAAAVAALHGRGVVHGGIDPRNVARPGAYFGGPVEPRLDNVGLVGAYRRHVGLRSLLDPRYAAPEYVERRYGRIDHATDVYALGATCYWLCTGRAPFAGGDEEEVCTAVLQERPPAPSAVDPDLPAALDDVLARALSKTKLARYETATRLHADLAALAEPTRA